MEPTPDTSTDTTWKDAANASAATQENEDAKPVKNGTAELTLSCKLSDEELIAKGALLADELGKIDQIDEEARAAASRFRERKKEHEEAASVLARVVRARAEDRKVHCSIWHILALGIARTVRDDTGEVVSERALSAHERQGKLFDDSATDGDDEEADSDGPGDLEDQLDAALAEGDAEDAITDPQALLDVSDDPDAKPAKKRGRR